CISRPENSGAMSGPSLLPQIGALIAAEATPDFPRCLAAFLRAITPYDFTVVFGYRGASQPLDLFDAFPAAQRAVFVTDSQAGPYLLDPSYLAAPRPGAPRLSLMRALAPARSSPGRS